MLELLAAARAARDTLRTPSLGARVSQLIEQLILDGRIGPGVRIIEENLAGSLGISRTSLREAMIGLEQAGLLSRDERGGRFIRTMTGADLRDLYEGWAILESEAAALACGEATDTDHRDIGALLAEMDRPMELAAYHRLNLTFHRALVRPCRNRWLLETYDGCVKQIRWAWALAISQAGEPRVSQKEHKSIFAVYCRRDAERTRALVRRHLARGAQRTTEAAETTANGAANAQSGRHRPAKTSG